ncbi:EamA family transporter [Balneatrix alpica]|uniref:EamA family transporter n=1 Tax=Balneatrix alpica TaxID=75684 RepID=A0ABV5Z7F8_9GAMM|nr:EamA family transporter [Balneatrix alpica]
MHTLLLAAIAPMLWGTTYWVTQTFMPADTPLWTATLRALPIGLLLASLARRPSWLWVGRSLLSGGLSVGLFFALLFIATYRLPGGVAATLGATLPLMAILVVWLVQKQKPQGLQLIASVAAVPGVGLLVLSGQAALDWIGVLAALASCLVLALGTLLTKRWGKPQGTPLLVFTGWQLTAGGLVLLLLAWVFEGHPPALSEKNLLGSLWLGLINTGLAYVIWFRQMPKLNLVQLAFLGLGSPLTAVILGQTLAGEAFTPWQWLGVAVVLGAMLVSQLGSKLGFGKKWRANRAAPLQAPASQCVSD